MRASAMFCSLSARPAAAAGCAGRNWTRRSAALDRRRAGRVWRDKLWHVCCGTGAGFSYQHYISRPHLLLWRLAALRAGVEYVLTFGEDASLPKE